MAESVLILNGIKDRYEKLHEVSYSNEVVEAFVNLSDRYIQDRFLPDKAIDLMDEVGARLNLANAENDTESIKQKLEKIAEEKDAAAEKLRMRWQITKSQDKRESSSGKNRKGWKPEIGRMNNVIINDGNFEQLTKYYDLYDPNQKR